ncbi:hypothetical protein OBBRIDRAFT_455629 [Obba rivulosa]|uniref:F-box domain-containing protein n=1 Tax=Obba rivulosa TaxID=1052685 RepID=A0A8E2AXX4_9APHY|nr:hypothetical protein OBBRIDRAFT_455629 [Obba rivulosa]
MVSCIRILAAWLPIRTQSAPAATQDSAIATKDPEPATKDPEPATEDLEPATEDLKPATEDLEPATEDPEPEGPLPEYEIANHLAHPHRALQMEDILHYVFEEVLLSVPYWDKFNGARENKATLARAARACKAFTKPALSVLWRDIENLVPLFRILSCVHTQDGTRQDQYFIRGPIDPTEWGRFQMYAQWPRKVACLSHFEKLHPSVFAGLSRYNNDKPLLSGLHTLSWRLKHPYNIVPIFALVPPSLCSLNITFATSNTTSETQQERRSSLDLLLRGLHARTSHLELLEIDGHADTTMLIAIGKLDSLRRVSMTGFGTPPVLQTQGILALAAMSNLTELNLPIEMEESRTAPELAVPVEFAQLQKLSVQGAPAHLSDFLARITSPQLTALNLRLTSCRRTSECQDLITFQGGRGYG